MKISKLFILTALLAPFSYGMTIEAGGTGFPVLMVDKGVTPYFVSRVKSSGVVQVINERCDLGVQKTKRDFVCVEKDLKGRLAVGVYGKKHSKKVGLSETDALGYAYELLTGEHDSPFSSSLAMVAKRDGKYTLFISDFKGENRRILHTAYSPILSPEWSPSGRYLTYLSYEMGRASIFVYDVIADRRLMAYSAKGLNGYPSFASDSELLISVSDQRINSDIVKLNLLNRKITRVMNTSRPEIYPKKSENGTAFLQMYGDLPYLFELADGKVVKKHGSPLHAFDISRHHSCWVGGLSKTLIISRNGRKSTLSFDKTVESPTMMNNCQFSYVVKDHPNGSYIVGFNVFDEQAIAISLKGYDLIQVSAY